MASIELKSGSSGSVILDAGNVTGEKRIDILRDLPWLSIPVGYTTQPLMIPDAAYYPTKDSDVYDFIMLSAGEDGVGGYNEGLLINEDIDASYEDANGHAVVRVTAEIAVGPMQGMVVDLINSENAALIAGASAVGTLFADQFQGHWHNFEGENGAGAASRITTGTNNRNTSTAFVETVDSIRSPKDDGVSGAPRTGSRTEIVHINGLVFMRVR